MLLVVPRISGGSAACSCISGFLGQFIPFWESLSSLSCARSMAYSFPTLVLAFLGGIENKPNFSSPISSLVIAVAIVAPSIFSFVNLLQFSSVAQLCPTLVTPWTAAHQASLSITNSRSPPKPMSIESVMPSNHLILCRPLLLLPSIFPSIRVFFKWVSSSHQVAEVLEFRLQHPSL